ncbi:MAG: sigma-70 family RNA polymerase sigma factor [Ruminiclostridium sp.]|nr:sigma-70 family RNA polymerase sigma factor [Ruminiclostridium sp.]
MTDEQLLANAANAEKSGSITEKNKYTALLITKYMAMIKNRARRFNNKYVEYEDLVSEGFLGLLNAIRSYDPNKGSFAALVSACVNNKMRSAITKSFDSHLKMSLDEALIEDISDNNPYTEDLIILKEQNNEMLKQVGELLSPREKEAFYLYLSAYSYNQIAEKLGISVKSVDNAISRAKTKLRDCFNNNNNTEQ